MIDVFIGASFDEYKKYLSKSVLTNNQRVKKLYDLIDLQISLHRCAYFA